MTPVRRTLALLVVPAALALVLPAAALAQFPLSKALWYEDVSLSAGTESVSFEGADPYLPEPHTETLTGTGYDLEGSVGFGESGPPMGTLMLAWDLTASGPSIQTSASVSISFNCRVIETATPPVAVTSVPVHVTATGSASAQGGVGAVANSVFRFQVFGAGILITDRVDVDDTPSTESPNSDSFAVDETPGLPVDAVTLVDLSSAASGGLVATGEARTGLITAVIDPVIEIVDDPVPGASGTYRDYYAIEFSEGYDAQTTPVQRITMGELKKRFIGGH